MDVMKIRATRSAAITAVVAATGWLAWEAVATIAVYGTEKHFAEHVLAPTLPLEQRGVEVWVWGEDEWEAVLLTDPPVHGDPRLDALPPALPGHVFSRAHEIDVDAFTFVYEPPFLLIGEEQPILVRARAERTIRPTSAWLMEEYFEVAPEPFVDVWLYADRDSYLDHTRYVAGDAPREAWGFYSGALRAIHLDASHGSPVVRHEIVHAHLDADCPGCPVWFDEGLATLYETTRRVDDRVLGTHNGRLETIQVTIWFDRTPRLGTLTGLDADEFYGEGSLLHYAQARYVCFYLQQQELLAPYYHRLRDGLAEDPSGHAILAELVGHVDMDHFQPVWEGYVASLRSPGVASFRPR